MRFLKLAFQPLFNIDYRSLIAYRIALGVILIFEVITKAANNLYFYTDLGAVPRALALKEFGPFDFSFHFASGSWWYIAILFGLQFVLAIYVLIGRHTRAAIFLSWVWIVSLQARNEIILNAGDALLRVLLFWSIFLPLSAYGSLDHGRRKKDAPEQICNLATAAILLQVLFMYFFTAILKNHPIWHTEKTAVYYAMQLEQFTTPIASLFKSQISLLKVITSATYYLELYGPVLLLIPFLGYLLRLPLTICFMMLHLSFIILLYLGLFPQTCIMAWLLFLPAYFWNFLAKFPFLCTFYQKLEMKCATLSRNSIGVFESWLGNIFRIQWNWKVSVPMPVKNVLVAFFLFATLLWNYSFVPPGMSVPDFFRNPAQMMRLDQKWNMFAPFPMKVDAWYVAEAKLRDGETIDLFTGKPPVWEKPSDLFGWYINSQWRKYLTNVWQFGSDQDEKLAYGKFLCRKWNDLEKHPTEREVLTYELFMFKEVSPPPGQPQGEPQKVSMWKHHCFN